MKIVLSIVFTALLGCKTNTGIMQSSTEKSTDFVPVFTSGPPLLVYKTNANYNNLVPIILSDDKMTIVSYPHPSDLKIGVDYSVPVVLKNGYLLDNRGINKNVAFLKITYDDFSKLENVPSLKELYNLILDKDPLVELCDCGIKTGLKDQIIQLNNLIENKKLRTTCKTIK